MYVYAEMFGALLSFLLSSLFTHPMQVDCEQVQRMATHKAFFFIPHLLYFTIIVIVIAHSIGRESKSVEYYGHCFANSQVVLY